MTPKEVLRRQTSCLFNTGVDPYNTADTIQVSRQLSLDFVAWVSEPAPAPEPSDLPMMLRHQAD